MAHDERQYSAADGTHQAGQKGKQGGKQKGKQGTQKLPKQKKTPEEIAELKRRALEEKEANPHAALDRKIAKAKEAEKMRMAQIAAPSAHPPSCQSECYMISISSLLSISFWLITMHFFVNR